MPKNERVFITLVKPGAALPKRASELASGYDISAVIDTDVVLAPNACALIPSGIALSLPPDMEAQVRPRSGLAFSHGVSVLNAPGTIDADYRGEIGVLLVNHGADPFTVKSGMRIAQLVFARVERPELALADTLDETPRGAGGFGHSGA
jgi:dUTP pyrophosphatase